ncbi:hypothetical protein ThidrDRAFT_4684 [Thiorhodococcus drewsii AZ1]|uniref:Probable zinc-binding domain-containing protein n=1 Tax=Thiorhodococcus drewsii AZ1 TaxID=765913 RepID=G2E8S0_9GAMM|nr:zinc-ribbon domain containing protein [Thiorhodococcus drewsii]EGV27503.1 hypothetical protein ThidrDRAFT_4684 [Thiorhodococcus drewsii AZ1]
MKSGKQRRNEIKAARLKRMAKRECSANPFKRPIPEWAVPVNQAEVHYHSMFFDIPLFYLDKEFVCKDCGAKEIWTAKQQKWWYEIAKGALETTAVRCSACRKKIREEKERQKKHMREMAERDPHKNEAFFKKTLKNHAADAPKARAADGRRYWDTK